MAVTAWRFPGTYSTNSPGDAAWANPENTGADDGNSAATSLNATQLTETLKVTNFGFVSGDFPAGYTLTGIEIEVDRLQIKVGTCEARDYLVRLYDASGALTGSDVADTATNWPNGSYGTKTYGGAGNMLGTSLTASDLQDADFGVAFRAQATSGTSSTIVGVDYIRVRAHISPPPSGDVTATPGAGSLTLTGQAPSVSASASVSPGVASLTITGYAPTVVAGSDATAAPGTGSLTLTGLAPTVAASSTAAPGVGGLTLAGNAPTVTASAVVSPAPGAVVITGYAPAVSASVAAAPAIAELVITGFAPTVTASSGAVDVTVTPDTGALVINGYAPEVTVTSAPAETGNSIIPSQRWTRRTGGMVPSREALELTSTDEWKRLLRQAEEAEAAVETLAPALPAKMVAKAARLAEALPDLAAVEAIAAAQTAAATVPLVTASAIRKARALIALAIEAERIAAEEAEDDDITAILLLAA